MDIKESVIRHIEAQPRPPGSDGKYAYATVDVSLDIAELYHPGFDAYVVAELQPYILALAEIARKGGAKRVTFGIATNP